VLPDGAGYRGATGGHSYRRTELPGTQLPAYRATGDTAPELPGTQHRVSGASDWSEGVRAGAHLFLRENTRSRRTPRGESRQNSMLAMPQ